MGQIFVAFSEYLNFNEDLTYSNPRVFDDIINAESLMGISFQHSSNEIFCILGHIFPFRVRKLVLTGTNALFHPRGNSQTMVTVEWRETT